MNDMTEEELRAALIKSSKLLREAHTILNQLQTTVRSYIEGVEKVTGKCSRCSKRISTK